MKHVASSECEDLETAARSHSAHPVSLLSSLRAPVSPPQRRSTIEVQEIRDLELHPGILEPETEHNLAAIEAGQVEVTDHLEIFSKRLGQHTRPHSETQSTPRLTICEWVNLYRRNAHPEGRHFVIHQHDHPVAGPRYDLRLQFSETSSVSWSIMYGLPGDPNSPRLNRNATETRIHCLWVCTW